MSFLYLTRLIGGEKHPIALHPAVTFDYYGKASFADGTDIWTVPIDSAEGTCAWRVAEDYGMVTGMLADLRAGAA